MNARSALPGQRIRRARSSARAIANGLALAAVFLLSIATAGAARAQHSGATGTAPPPPAGDGRIAVRIVNPDDAKDVAGLEIALYSLGSDGQPGFTSGKTDAEGRVSFPGVSNDPGIVYLIGARYREIPFGERVTFEANATEAAVEIAVSEPTDRTEGVRVEELRVRLDWMGDRVLVREILRLVNPGKRVIQLGKADGAKGAAIVRRRLSSTARDFKAGTTSIADGLTLEDGVVRYVGPLYPGDQGIEYQYSLPSPPKAERLRVPVELDLAAARVVAVAGTSGMAISGPDFVASSEVSSDSGKPLAAWARGALGAHARSYLEATLPETRLDPSLVEIPRADVWLDLDDTRLTATVDIQVEVAPGAPVAGTLVAPLLSVTLPEGASLTGVAPEAEALGLVPRENGGFDVIGPVGEGVTSLGYAYRLDAKPAGLALDLRFSRNVATLNVLVADTGLALDSSRLHRLRPFRSGTRNYLHREAFNVTPDEAVDLRLEPLRAHGVPQKAGMALMFVSIAGAAAFLMAPLRKGAARAAVTGESALTRLRAEREAAYAAIHDVEHDFETGKLDGADYTAMRDALRTRAIELLGAERAEESATAAGNVAATASATSPALAASAASNTAATATANTTASAGSGERFCPSCGTPRDPAWRFCASCGAALSARREAGA